MIQRKNTSYLFLFFALTMLLSCGMRNRTANEIRHDFDTTLFTGTATPYSSEMKNLVIKTEAYKKYLTTTNGDSVHTYLLQAETEAKEKLNIK